jgi:hypothetical protein
MYGGIVTVESELGKGTQFVLEFPERIQMRMLSPEVSGTNNVSQPLSPLHSLLVTEKPKDSKTRNANPAFLQKLFRWCRHRFGR